MTCFCWKKAVLSGDWKIAFKDELQPTEPETTEAEDFNGSEFTNEDDDGIRLIRLVNDAEGGEPFTTGQTIDGNISGWHWYADDESESVETGYSVTIGELKDGAYTVTVNKN